MRSIGRHFVPSVLPPFVSSVWIWSCNTGFLCHSKWLLPLGEKKRKWFWERWLSGLWQRSWKPPRGNPPWVRILLSPPFFFPFFQSTRRSKKFWLPIKPVDTKGFTKHIAVCLKHTQTSKSDRFSGKIRRFQSEFWRFRKPFKNKSQYRTHWLST